MAQGGVHLFLARKLKKEEWESQSYFWGNLLPDAEHLMKRKEEIALNEKHGGGEHRGREKFKEIFGDNQSLWAGMKVHFLVDEYVHGRYVAEMVKKFGKWDSRLVHLLTEIAMDRVLAKRNKEMKQFYDEVAGKVDVKGYGERLGKIFPGSKWGGEEVLKDGIEMLRVSNLTSWLKINKVRKIIKKYNPFTEISPNVFKLFYMMKRIEREVEKDLEEFLERTGEELKAKV